MKAAGVFVLVCIAALITRAKADGTCETIGNGYYGPFGTLKTCDMKTTAVDSKDFLITSDRDESVELFNALTNKKLEHLPNNLGAKFPSLFILDARACSIREVSKDNFIGLNKLRRLWLGENQIEKVDNDTFEYIPAVEVIWLYYNKIKEINGLAFASLHKLTQVSLRGNECIDEDFETPARIAELPRVVTGKCGLTETEPSPTNNVTSEPDLMAQSAELQALKLENAKLKIEKAKADLQIAHHKELQAQHNEIKAQHNEIKAQLKEICDARLELKVQEIFHLSNDLQAKIAEINEKNEKIKQCEKKN